MDSNRLRGRIIEKFGSNRAFADAIGCCQETVANYLSGARTINRVTIVKWCDALEIPMDEIAAYFFAKDVQK